MLLLLQSVVIDALWKFAKEKQLFPYSALLPTVASTEPSVNGLIVDNMFYMMPAVWGRKGKTLYVLLKAIAAATPSFSGSLSSLKKALKIKLPTVCGARNVKRKQGFPCRLTAWAVISAALRGSDTVMSAGECCFVLLL